MRANLRQGFTLVELLVVIGIIGMLLALLVPGLFDQGRVPARRSSCANNLRQVAQALQVYETNKRAFPGRVNEVAVWLRSQSQPASNTVSWVASILPELERSDIYDYVQSGKLTAATPQGEIPRVEIFICPSDVRATADTPGLSYVVNAGYWDRPGEIAAGDFAENGMFFGRSVRRSGVLGGWALAADSQISMSLDQVLDGVAKTLLISENVQAGPPAAAAQDAAAPRTWLLSPTEQGDAFVWVSEPTKQAGINKARDAAADYKWPYYCRPSSNHAGGVNVAFCDGHIDFLREDIDYKVYYELMTPRGNKGKIPPTGVAAPDAWRQFHLDEDDYR